MDVVLLGLPHKISAHKVPEIMETDAKIVDLSGAVLGRHDGVINFTVGQRRGLNIGGTGDPLYVVRVEPAAHRVVVGPKEALAVEGLGCSEVNWLADASDGAGREVAVKIRSASEPVAATVAVEPARGARVLFAEPQYGVSPGQACVFYEGDRVLGGGWIDRGDGRLAAE